MIRVSEYWGWERDEERHGDLLEIRQQDERIFGIIEDQREGWIKESRDQKGRVEISQGGVREGDPIVCSLVLFI